MTESLRSLSLLFVSLALLLHAPARAADSHPCAVVPGAAERLACYDKAFPPPPEVHAAAARQAERDFGLERKPVVVLNPGQTPADADPDRIEARVASVDHGRAGRRAIALENGQVWTLVEPTSSGPLRPGDTVTMRKGLLGSFLLTTPSGVTLRVRRTR